VLSSDGRRRVHKIADIVDISIGKAYGIITQDLNQGKCVHHDSIGYLLMKNRDDELKHQRRFCNGARSRVNASFTK